MVAVPRLPHRTVDSHPTLSKVLLASGLVAPAWWVAMDILGSLRYPGYSYTNQTVSELSAEGAPTRVFMMVTSGIPYTVMLMAFGAGIWGVAGGRRAGRITGALVVVGAVAGEVGWVLFPMQMRGNEATLRNVLHLPYVGIGSLLLLLAIAFGSRLLGRRFRYFSYGTIVTLLVFGVLTGLRSSGIAANEPTPWLGIVERTNAYAGMLWFAVLALGLLRDGAGSARQTQRPPVPPQTAPRERGKAAV